MVEVVGEEEEVEDTVALVGETIALTGEAGEDSGGEAGGRHWTVTNEVEEEGEATNRKEEVAGAGAEGGDRDEVLLAASSQHRHLSDGETHNSNLLKLNVPVGKVKQ